MRRQGMLASEHSKEPAVAGPRSAIYTQLYAERGFVLAVQQDPARHPATTLEGEAPHAA